MYYNKRKLIANIIILAIGIVIIVMGVKGIIDEDIWMGFGSGLVAVSIFSIIKKIRYGTDKEYKNKIDIEAGDERNRFLRMKAWSYAGYIYIIAAAVVEIVCMVRKDMHTAAILGYGVCFILIVYVASYMILQRKE